MLTGANTQTEAWQTIFGLYIRRFGDLRLPGVVPPGSDLLGHALESLGQQNGPTQDMRMTGVIVIGVWCGPKSSTRLRLARLLLRPT